MYKKLTIVLIKYKIKCKAHLFNRLYMYNLKFNFKLISQWVNRNNIYIILNLFNNLNSFKFINNDLIFILNNSIVYYNFFLNKFISYNINITFKKFIKCLLMRVYNQIIFNFSNSFKKLKNILNNSHNIYFDLSKVFYQNKYSLINYRLLVVFLYNIINYSST